jgi:hypothetical protein
VSKPFRFAERQPAQFDVHGSAHLSIERMKTAHRL